ncbi:hypothetical protein [Bacillus atrophaeus]|uniref:hypothetical protein n=1 Tax=Bacillus atrophaeus TaxID=1452 RepID=UPI00227DE374|nr:hypothetical protein [Bacillus atrophaeus]MCY8976033.1 hypothetical protein [Bacillus atrophaeus]MCY9203622.1 hypothetical protein [Bacillus atrophaeus]MEC0885685.1 hypothetical protein [Bacillus atrophaeus]
MNWDNIHKILDKYTQYKHYVLFFEKYRLDLKNSREKMARELEKAVEDHGFLGPVISQNILEDWLVSHQIDGNNYTFVYQLLNPVNLEIIKQRYEHRAEFIDLKLWEIDPTNDSKELAFVMPELDDTKLIGIQTDENKETFTFSFVSPCIINGMEKDGSNRLYKKMFFSHVVFFTETKDFKIVFNPTANLVNVNGVKKEKRNDWTSIADHILCKVKQFIGDDFFIQSPKWIPEAFYRLAEDATQHKNPKITEASFRAQERIEKFATSLLSGAGLDIDFEPALMDKFIQDIQISFEAQLIEKLGYNDDENSISIFKQRSDGVTHIINVESTEEGFKGGSAAQAARRSRLDGDIDLLGVILKKDGRVYKFLVEYGPDAYLIRGTNTFIEEEVVNIVIRQLNEYRSEIQNSQISNSENGT